MAGKILEANPESACSIVCAENDGKAIFTSCTDTVVDGRTYDEITVANCSRSKSLILKGAAGKSFRVVNCMGEELCEGVVDGNLCEIKVPTAGMVFVK